LQNYFHFSPIRKVCFVSKIGSSGGQIGVIDELMTVSMWSVYEIQQHIAEKIGDFDLNMTIGGRFKLLENYSENLMLSSNVFSVDEQLDIAQSMDIEFDPTDPNTFYFSHSEGLFKFNRKISSEPNKLDTVGMGTPTCLSVSDRGYLLVGFTCGSIA
jgi:hypothetical protein